MLGFPRMASLSAMSFEMNLSIWFSFLLVPFEKVFLSQCVFRNVHSLLYRTMGLLFSSCLLYVFI
jgi:hypothetical protein